MRRFLLSTVLLACAAVAAAPAADSPTGSQAPSPAPLTPEAIYLRAIHAMKEAPAPAYVTFHEDVSVRNLRLTCTQDGESLTLKHGDASGAYDVCFRTRDENAVSEDIATRKRCRGALLLPAGEEIASLGAVPSASPSASAASVGDGPPIIAAVRVESARYYKIALVDRETFAGHPVYRLALAAYRDPTTHPLTGLLVDETTFLVRQATGEAAGHYVVASGRVAGSVTFDRSGPYWMAQDERFEFALQAIFVHAHCNVHVIATDFAFPDDIVGVFPSPSPSPTAKRAP